MASSILERKLSTLTREEMLQVCEYCKEYNISKVAEDIQIKCGLDDENFSDILSVRDTDLANKYYNISHEGQYLVLIYYIKYCNPNISDINLSKIINAVHVRNESNTEQVYDILKLYKQVMKSSMGKYLD